MRFVLTDRRAGLLNDWISGHGWFEKEAESAKSVVRPMKEL
jgi:hypothetical protein